MVEAAIWKRPFHAFLSHAHVDRDEADSLYSFLSEVAGIPIWYDAINLPPGATVVDNLFGAIENSRAAIILLSRQSVTRGWVKQEYRAAINHQTQYPDFRIIPLRLDDVEPPDFLQNYSNIQVNPESLDSGAAAHILKALYQSSDAAINPVQGRHIYFARGWQSGDADFTKALSEALSRAGLRRVGDAADQSAWVEERITEIMDGCGAFAAALPYRPTAPHKTSKYALREWELAVRRDLPCLVVPHPGVDLPDEAKRWPGLVEATHDPEALFSHASDLAEEWRLPRHEPYIFYATDFGSAGKALRVLNKDVMEASTGLPCRIGEYVEGVSVQREILRIVAKASVLVADISGDSFNVYIEIGAARAAGIPVALLRKGPPGRPAFMLRDQQVYDYRTDAESVARAVRVTYPYRRFLQV